MKNPFITGRVPGVGDVQAADVESRLPLVAGFNAAKCHAALQVPGLQKTVRKAIERRLRQVEKDLSQDQVEAMKAVKNGADVYSYGIARALREVHNVRPDLVTITKPMTRKFTGVERMPYFGAILTREGKRAIAKKAGAR